MERGALGNAGARSADVKSGRSAERQWKNGPERGALETPGRAPRNFLVPFIGAGTFSRISFVGPFQVPLVRRSTFPRTKKRSSRGVFKSFVV